jgi:hypothetical protein
LASRIHKNCLPAQAWKVLDKIKRVAARHEAVLAGGSALALQIGHHISFDLDFFTRKPFRPDKLISEIRKATGHFQVLTGEEGTLILEIEGMKVAFSQYEHPFLAKIIEHAGTRIAGMLDIASMKVIAISQRGVKRDFVDLYFILQKIPFHLIASHVVKRFGRERINPAHIGKSLLWFADADTNPEPAYVKGREKSWDSIKEFFRTHVKQFTLDLEAARETETA